MKIVLFILISVCIYVPAVSQRVIQTSADAENSILTNDTLIDIHLQPFTNKLVLLNKQNKKSFFDNASNWGYENKEHQIFRKEKGVYYLVVNLKGPIYIYFTQSDETKRREQNYLFSVTLGSEILYLNKKNLLKAYGSDECLKRNFYSLSSNGDLNKEEAEKINILYEQCHPKTH